MLAKEGLLLGKHHQFITIWPFPQPCSLVVFTNTCLSLGSLTFLNVAHDPLPFFRPFIPTITPRNSTFSFLRKSGISISSNHSSHACVISSRIGIFSSTKEYTPDASVTGTLQHLLHMTPCPPYSTVWWRSCGGDFLWVFEKELSHLLFLPLCEETRCPNFWIFNAQESIWGAPFLTL